MLVIIWLSWELWTQFMNQNDVSNPFSGAFRGTLTSFTEQHYAGDACGALASDVLTVLSHAEGVLFH